MNATTSSGSLAILGATGYTGRLCAREAVEQGLDVVLAGRDPAKLAALSAELGGPPTAVVDVRDGVALRELAEHAGVLLTTVGPYVRHGRPALLAALDGGCHYVDVSGEVPFLAWVREHDEDARRAGIALCPGFGFDGFPGDLLAGLAAGQLEGPIEHARVAYLIRGGRASGGTLRTMLGLLDGGGAAWRDGGLVAEPALVRRWKAPFPSPLGARDAVSVPMPDVLTLAASTRARDAESFLVLPAAPLVAAGAAPFQAALRPVLRAGLGRRLERLGERLPEGPSPEQRRRTRAAVLAEVGGPDGIARAWCRLRDPYGITARIAVGTAARLLAQGPPRSGALTPTEALDGDAGGFLRGVGASWQYC